MGLKKGGSMGGGLYLGDRRYLHSTHWHVSEGPLRDWYCIDHVDHITNLFSVDGSAVISANPKSFSKNRSSAWQTFMNRNCTLKVTSYRKWEVCVTCFGTKSTMWSFHLFISETSSIVKVRSGYSVTSSAMLDDHWSVLSEIFTNVAPAEYI